jgi:pSer/pThr/pTyr-binding forkhead associated (FHA) protein
MAVLIGMSGDVKGKNFPLDGEDLTIGRNADNKVSINNASVSGHHAVIARDGDNYMLRDLGSTNGTRVNSHETKEHVLKPKDLIQFGSVEFLFNSETISMDDAQSAVFTKTEEMVADSSTARPESFNSISPFGARRRENQAMWGTILIALGVVAVLVVIYLFFKLITV